ncbi:MAG: AmmeMemoRadiSam system protein A [Deltaproteobacteria bacterium]|nr:AmmeMemoRadiSam system protein A [Deltaproteobacteria bacterium]
MSLDSPAQKRLLTLARQTIAARLEGQAPPKVGESDLGRGQGAFVTLHRQGALRGCIGSFEGRGSLAGTIQEMAISAAFQDPRFPPLASMPELEECHLEISVLSPLKETDPESIEVGRHGIYIISGPSRGVLLPQVAAEQGWDRKTFLDQTCLKAGLATGCWQEKGTKVLSFTAQIFGEEAD